MIDMDDELDADDLGLDDDFDDFDSEGPATLGGSAKDSPIVKIGIIGAVVVAVFGVIMLFGGGDNQEETPSLLPGGSSISAAPGSELSPAMRNQIEIQNETQREQAELMGESAIPTPLETPSDVLNISDGDDEDEDPLQRWRQLQQERFDEELATVQPVPQGVVLQETNNQEAIQLLADLMSEQMSAILESRTAVQVQTKDINSTGYLDRLEEEREQEAFEAAQAAQQDLGEQETEVLVAAGEIAYSQLLIEANSDVPGPVLAQIVSGPLKGSRVLGDFESNYDTLTLNFNIVVIDDESVGFNGIAIDPNTTLPGLATEVDRRYFKRIVLPAAAAFIEGAAEAISESGLTTVTISGEAVAEETEETDSDQEIAAGVEEAAEELSEILDDIQSETKTLIRIEAGTPFGLLFLEPVIVGADGSPIQLQAQETGQPPADGNGLLLQPGGIPGVPDLASGL